MISNGNRTELGPIWSVIIRVMNKIGLPRSRSPIYLITSIITDRIRRQDGAMARTVQAVYTAISRTVVGKSARDNPERHCGWF